jgi:hypothetical protein
MANTTTTTTPATPPASKPRRKRRVFMWTFLAIQALFLVWVGSVLFAGTGASPSEIAAMCAHGQWQGVFQSYNDCVVHGAHGIIAAHDVGKAVGLGLQIGLWVAVDVILGIGRLVVVFARRGRTAT